MERAKTVLITGATAGIGRHAALYLAKKGYHVFATGRRKEALTELKAQAEGLKLETFELDVTDPESVRSAVAEVDRSTNGYGLDALVNNAGYGLIGPLEVLSDDDLRRQFNTNVFGLMAMTRAFLPQMRKRGSGRIVNVSSTGGRMTFPLMGAYNATKYAVESLSDALRNEVHRFGIRVALIEPGYIRTEFADVALSTTNRYDVPESPYASMFKATGKGLKAFEATGVGPIHTSKAIEKAIASSSPWARYVSPWRTYVGLAVYKLMPTRVMDFLLRAFLGANR